MHRIDAEGHVANRFTSGNPQAGQRATRVSAEWLNDVQENIVRVIEAAGNPLTKGDADDLYDAIVQIVAGAVGTGGANVPTTRQVLGGGLITGGGPLAADVTLTLAAASAAEIIAGVVATKAITPAGLAAAMASVKTTPGYATLPNGVILQWGTGTALGNSTTIFNLPTTFPTACAFAGVEGGSAVNDAQDNNPFVNGRGVSTISVYNAQNGSQACNFFAIGF